MTLPLNPFLRNTIFTESMATDANICKIPSSRCNLIFYIEECDNIPLRLQQQKNDVRNTNHNNPIVKHFVNTDHPVPINQSIAIKNISNIKKRKLTLFFLAYSYRIV